MPNTYRIHPAIGIARVGDAEEPGFLGPESPDVPANWNFITAEFDKFKVGGRIRRQGVRFRIFEFDPQGGLVGEVAPGQGNVVDIEWTVHVANRKASFFQFVGPNGEDGDFSKNGARNPDVRGAAARAELEIDPGPHSVSGRSAGPVILTNPNSKTNGTIKDLGDIRTDDAARLLFFGGHGKTLQLLGAPDITDYVNNDGWFDDASDGPITAVIRFVDGQRVEALHAWVSVGPPDFAPALGNVVSMYETIWDVVVRNPAIPIPDLAMYRTGGALARLQQQRDDWDPVTNRFKTHKPSYVNDILHVLQRAFSATFVHNPPDLKKTFHNTLGPQVWADLGDSDPIKGSLRRDLFRRLRDPDSTVRADSNQMPRGLGDEYCNEEEESKSNPAALENPRRFFSITRVQYALLAQWANGQFDPDGVSARPIPASPPPITPEGLDRAALENCVGGPFFPGIEVSWAIRNPSLYVEPFRLRRGATIGRGDPAIGIPDVTVRPGVLTQQMALPWQADFRDCKMESLTNTATGEPAYAMWWSAQRPDDVFPEDTPNQQVRWTRPPQFNVEDGDEERYKEMVERWHTLGYVARRSADQKRWLETERS